MRRTTLAGTILTTALVLGSLAGPTAGSAPREDPRAERERVRAEQAEVARQIDASEATVAEIDEALAVLEENLAAEEAALSAVEDELARAEQDIADAEASIATLEDDVVVLRETVRDRAVRAYVSPPGDDVLTVLESSDFTTASARKFYIQLRASSDADVADKLDGALADLDHQHEVAAEAKVRAEDKQAEEAERTEAVRQARDDKQAVADSIQSTINAKLEESVRLAATDQALSKQIAEEQAALVARLVAQQAKDQEAAEAAAAAQAAAAQTPRPSPQNANGSENTPEPPAPPAGGPSTGTGGISLCWAGGIQVNCIVADQVSAMVSAAAADGVSLSGGGYRDPQRQIELRQAHCGSSYYAIYQMPSSQCSPPTARPGSSQHEVGLAIDFSNCGRSSACFGWLSGNAASFGFYNLPSESWHWSTSGS